jgi:hypothetical protein
LSEPDRDAFPGRATIGGQAAVAAKIKSSSALRLAVMIATLLLGVPLAACGGSSTSPSSDSATPPAQIATNSSGSSNAGTFDVVVSGGLQVEWKSGASDVSRYSCVLPPAFPGSFISVSGSIGGKPYILQVIQAAFGAGTFTYPISSVASLLVPLVQITTKIDKTVNWTASKTNGGSGAVTISGGGAGMVSVALDLDLTPVNAQPVHVKGTLQCLPPAG